MPAASSKYEFRILIETTDGHQYSYGTSSLVNVPANQSKVVTTDDMMERIIIMPSMSYYNAPAFTTSSALYNTPADVPIDIDRFGSTETGQRTFTDTTLPDGITTYTDVSYQFVSCSIKDHHLSGSIIFHSNTTPSTHAATGNKDTLKRYKFWGNKVCQVLGLPENYWIYSDKFRLSNTGSEDNYLTGDVLATSINIRDNFAISNAASITSDLPFRHYREADRYIRWTDISSSIPQNKMLVGYTQGQNTYGVTMPDETHLFLSASAVTASQTMLVRGNLRVDGTIVGNSYNPQGLDGSTNVVPVSFGGAITTNSNITASGNISASGDVHSFGGSVGIDINEAQDYGKLHVHEASSDFNYIRVTNATTGTGASDGLYVGLDASENSIIRSYDTGHMIFGRGGSEGFRIADNNNIGIGTTTPSSKLAVHGDISASGNAYIAGDGTGGSLYVGGNIMDSSLNRFRFHHNTIDGYIDIKNTDTRAGNINFRGLTGDVTYNTAVTMNLDSGHITASGGISASGELYTGRHQPDYDSGWFAVDKNTAYAKTLPWTFSTSELPRVRIFVSDDATPVLGTDYIDEVRQAQYYYSGKGMGVYMSYTADNEITLHTGKNYVYYRTTAGGALAAATYQNSGYLLVQAWK